jgi:hypothetical protein
VVQFGQLLRQAQVTCSRRCTRSEQRRITPAARSQSGVPHALTK